MLSLFSCIPYKLYLYTWWCWPQHLTCLNKGGSYSWCLTTPSNFSNIFKSSIKQQRERVWERNLIDWPLNFSTPTRQYSCLTFLRSLASDSKRGGTKESIQSRTGVRQGCLIFPLLFVIVFDILLVSLKKKHNPQDLSGFMDDLGMVLQKVETINSLTPTFKKYEEATEAKLNFNKCFVLSTESYKPVGPWAEMAWFNYCGDETVYLGVRLSKWLSPFKDWEKVVLKMKKVGAAIKKKGSNFCSRVRMVNTYLTPCMEYLARFKLILKSITSLMWKFIHSALGAYANMKTSILTSCYPPLDSNPQLHYSIVFNWALLTSCSPMRSDYQSPLSIGAMQKDVLFAAQSLSAKVVFG